MSNFQSCNVIFQHGFLSIPGSGQWLPFFSLMIVISQPRGRANEKFGFRILKIIAFSWSFQGYAVSGHAMPLSGCRRPFNKRKRPVEHKREELSGSGRSAKVVGGGGGGEDGFLSHPCPASPSRFDFLFLPMFKLSASLLLILLWFILYLSPGTSACAWYSPEILNPINVYLLNTYFVMSLLLSWNEIYRSLKHKTHN